MRATQEKRHKTKGTPTLAGLSGAGEGSFVLISFQPYSASCFSVSS